MIIVDTSVWVRYLRFPGSDEGRELDNLLQKRQVALAGVMLAEILQGARDPQDFEELGVQLASLPYVSETKNTWIQVGVLSYQMRQQGRLIPLTDLTVAALAMEHGHSLYTLDEHFQRVPGLQLHIAGSA